MRHLSHLSKAAFSQHRQEGKITQFDLAQAVGTEAAGAPIICLCDHLLSRA